MIQPIETVYNGYRFRSRLEARWGVFFTAVGIKFRYEEEGFSLGGMSYLPDFFLPYFDCYVEVKPIFPTQQEREKMIRLCIASQKDCYILSGDTWQDVTISAFSIIPDISFAKKKIEEGNNSGELQIVQISKNEFAVVGDDTNLCFVDLARGYFAHQARFAECQGCNLVFISSEQYCKCSRDTPIDYASSRLVAAYTAARQARFEHGETPHR